MTTTTKSIIAVVVAIIGIAIYGAYQYPQSVASVVSLGSATGSTFNTAKVAAIAMAPITSAATSTSILNGDASARIIDSGFVSCATSTGSVLGATGGVATWTWQMATTSVASQGLQGNTNFAENITVATSTVNYSYSASSTEGVLFATSRFWPSGTYLSINTNATTTNNLTATCQAGVYYHGT